MYSKLNFGFLRSMTVVLAWSVVAGATVGAQVDTSMKARMKMDSAKAGKMEQKMTAKDAKEMKMDHKMDMKTDMKMDHKMDGKMEGKMSDKMGSMDMKKMMEGEHASSGWKELDAYHQLMMATWHPVMEKGDLAPARAKAADLSASAKAWSESKAPAGCDTPELSRALGDVVKGSNSLAGLVAQSANDSTVKSEMAALHKRFEVLEMGCKPAKPAKP